MTVLGAVLVLAAIVVLLSLVAPKLAENDIDPKGAALYVAVMAASSALVIAFVFFLVELVLP